LSPGPRPHGSTGTGAHRAGWSSRRPSSRARCSWSRTASGARRSGGS